MSQFTGATVAVLLHSGIALQGVVATVAGPQLTLKNVYNPITGARYNFYTITGTEIKDIDIIDDGDVTTPQAQYAPPLPTPPPSSVYLSHPPASRPFVDPAIVSFSRHPGPPSSATRVPQPSLPIIQQGTIPPQPPQHTHSQETITGVVHDNRRPGNRVETKKEPGSDSIRKGSLTNTLRSVPTPPATTFPSVQNQLQTLEVPLSNLNLGDGAESSAFDETDDPGQPQSINHLVPKYSGKRSRRGKLHKDGSSGGSFEGSNQPRLILPRSDSYNTNHQRGQGAGEIQRSRRRHKYQQSMASGQEDGWATEDVNDIKDQEFDFQSNLDRFDKKTVFSQIQAEDSTAIEDRLVSHNRLPQPSSKAGQVKKNFKNTENVLGLYTNGQSLIDREGWNENEFLKESVPGATSNSEDDSDRGRGEINSGRSSRRAISRQNRRPPGLRNGSTVDKGGASPNISSGFGSGAGGGAAAAGATGGGGAGTIETKSTKPVLRLLPSKRPCPVVSPLQMLDVEAIAERELGLTDDMMTENAGRGIAQVAIQVFGKSRLHIGNHNSLPVVLVFAGNNKSGARAAAAARHLKNHHVRVLMCVLGLEREEELTDNFRRQISIFRNAGGRLARWEEFSSNLKTLDSPPELIIDGLLGLHVAFEDLRVDDQATAFEIVNFANKSKAQILSIDVPSGIDGQNGEVAQIEGTGIFHVRSKFLVCMGAPKIGIMHAIASGVGASWSLFVVDLGIPTQAWRKYGTRRRHGVEFAAEWVAALDYHVPSS